jgi:hypothetical protein
MILRSPRLPTGLRGSTLTNEDQFRAAVFRRPGSVLVEVFLLRARFDCLALEAIVGTDSGNLISDFCWFPGVEVLRHFWKGSWANESRLGGCLTVM